MRRYFFTLCCLFLVISAAFAQSDRGTITGTISDPAGAMIPNASITAQNTETGAVYETVSTATGNYTIPQLPAGLYQLSASMPGFKNFVRTGINVLVAATLRIDIQMEIGNISETVTVSEDAPLLKTESGELSHNITSDRMDDLPLLSIAGGIRSAYDSVNLIPGAQRMSVPGGIFGTLRVNGMPGGSLALRIEGQDATQQTWSAAFTMSQPSLDSIEETAIQTSKYAAEFGQAGGGIMHFVFWDSTPGFGTFDAEKELGLTGTTKGVYPTIMNIYQNQGGGMASASGQGNSFGPIAQQKQWEQKPTGTAALTWVKNNHTFKFGAELRVESFPSTATTPSNGWFYFSPAQTALPYLNTTSYGGGNLGFPYASFLLGEVNNGEIGVESHFHIGKHSLALFV
jgi:hypothetical protein